MIFKTLPQYGGGYIPIFLNQQHKGLVFRVLMFPIEMAIISEWIFILVASEYICIIFPLDPIDCFYIHFLLSITVDPHIVTYRNLSKITQIQ